MKARLSFDYDVGSQTTKPITYSEDYGLEICPKCSARQMNLAAVYDSGIEHWWCGDCGEWYDIKAGEVVNGR